MKKMTMMIALFVGLAAASVTSVGQQSIEDFPLGTTTMVYEIVSDEYTEPVTLALTIEVQEDAIYRMDMSIGAQGTADQLQGFGFMFLGAGVSTGGGEDISYSALEALFARSELLEEGEDYILPRGGSFTEIVAIEIASVWCLEGVLVNPENPDVRTTVAFALTYPVYSSPRLTVQERVNGEWVTTFSMELTEYVFTAPEGQQ
ncbi:hypothetical protein JW848_04345 [Candidatus Bipolaricaulota bacterium]|nr:hypothetical protein [Candidatus Bipolaricaulota bacterium]